MSGGLELMEKKKKELKSILKFLGCLVGVHEYGPVIKNYNTLVIVGVKNVVSTK